MKIYKEDGIKLYNGDCLEVMDILIQEGIKFDAIITDPPYGTTACKWDSIIPLDEMWDRLKKLRKDNTPIVLFGSEPFSSALRISNIKEYKYDWTWLKHHKTGHFNAKNRPMKIIENISVFYKKQCNYIPQGLIEVNKHTKNSDSTMNRGGDNNTSVVANRPPTKEYFQKYTNYPIELLKFNSMNANGVHPTQKPLDLLEYLIKTYTNEGDIVLDFTMGSGTTGVDCKKLNRKFIGAELDAKYFDISVDRIKSVNIIEE